MIGELLIVFVLLLPALTFYFIPSLIAWRRQHPDLAFIRFYNLRYGWTLVGWFKAFSLALGTFEPVPPRPPVVFSSSETMTRDPWVDTVARLLELPSADRTLTLRADDGRGVQLVCATGRPLALRLAGPWSAEEQGAAQGILASEVAAAPLQLSLPKTEDARPGVVLSGENPYVAATVIRRLVTECLGKDADQLTVERDYDDHDARPEIVATLESQGGVEIEHPESGVRVRVQLYATGDTTGDTTSGYWVEVPTACLDPRRNQRHRAREAINDAGWRLADMDLSSGPDVEGAPDDQDTTWGFAASRGTAEEATERAFRLLCTIAEAPLDVRLSLSPLTPRS